MICPRSAILQSAAASMVEGIFVVTVSTAERIATFGVPMPMPTQRSMAFWTMSRLASRSGKMLIAASVMKSVSGWPGTSMMKTWLMRRSVRRPVAEAVTAFISSSVCRLPFISSSPLPSRISATAWAAAAWLCGASTIWRPARSMPCSAATSRIFASGPTRTGSISPSAAASIAPRSEVSSQGWATIVTAGVPSRAAAIRRSYLFGWSRARGSPGCQDALRLVTSSGPRPKSAAMRRSRSAGAARVRRSPRPRAEGREGVPALLDGSGIRPGIARSAASSSTRSIRYCSRPVP